MIPIRALIALAATASAGLFLWALASGSDTVPPYTLHANRDIDQFTLGDRSLQGDLLSARAGILRNYDPLNRDAALASTAAHDLVRISAGDPGMLKAAQKLAAYSDRRDQLLERFKTDNSLLQNSLARFGSLGALLMRSPGATRISASMLELTLDTSPDAVRAATASLDAFERGSGHLKSRPEAQIYTHGRILIHLLPEVDRVLAESRALPIDHAAAELRQLIAARHALKDAQRTRARILRAYAAVLTIGLLGAFGFSIYARDRDLRRRAENEHLSATVSALLIGVRAHDLDEHVERALQQLALHVGGDRAYLVTDAASPDKVFGWTAARPLPPGWPAQVTGQALRQGGWREHMLLASSSVKTRDGALAGVLEAAGVASLLLIRAHTDDAAGGAMLGFESSGQPLKVRSDTAAGLLAALAAILETLRRDGLEAEQARLERRLARARRMETVGAVASGVAHNFNNIIGAISGFSEMAELHVSPGSKAAADLAEIHHAVGRGQALVDQILGFGRRSQGENQWIGLAELIAETSRLLQASLPSGIRLDTRIAPDVGDIKGDAGQLQQVVMNICKNAAHALAGQGVVIVSVERRRLAGVLSLSHGALDAGVYDVITIEDRGPGIAPQVLPRIFEPFFTTRRSGTGLGLSTAWEIVQDHGGTIDVHSQPGEGAAFGIWLPGAQRPAPSATDTPPQGQGEAVLLILQEPEDAPERLHAHEDLLAMLGYEVAALTHAAYRREGVRFDGRFDAIVVGGTSRRDVQAIARSVRNETSGTPVILAYPDALPDQAVEASQVIGYPLREAELAEALAAALHTSAPTPAHAPSP